MREHEFAHARLVGQLRGLHGGEVVVGGVAQHAGEASIAARLDHAGHRLEHVVGFGLAHEHIRTACCCNERRIEGGVAADHDRSSPIIEAVGERRGDRPVVDFDGGHLDAALLEHDGAAALRRFTRAREADEARLHHRSGRRHQPFAVVVVRVTIAAVEGVDGVEAIDHLLDTLRSMHLQRLAPPLRPAHEIELAEFADVVGVEMREEHMLDAGHRYAPEGEVLARFRTDVDEEDLFACRDDRAGFRRIPRRHRARGPAEQHAQRIVVRGQRVWPRDLGARAALDHGVLQRGREAEGGVSGGRCRDRDRCDEQKWTEPTLHDAVRVWKFPTRM